MHGKKKVHLKGLNLTFPKIVVLVLSSKHLTRLTKIVGGIAVEEIVQDAAGQVS